MMTYVLRLSAATRALLVVVHFALGQNAAVGPPRDGTWRCLDFYVLAKVLVRDLDTHGGI